MPSLRKLREGHGLPLVPTQRGPPGLQNRELRHASFGHLGFSSFVARK
jgi:hypothetical protein